MIEHPLEAQKVTREKLHFRAFEKSRLFFESNKMISAQTGLPTIGVININSLYATCIGVSKFQSEKLEAVEDNINRQAKRQRPNPAANGDKYSYLFLETKDKWPELLVTVMQDGLDKGMVL